MTKKQAADLLTATIPDWEDMSPTEFRHAVQAIASGRSTLRSAWAVATAPKGKRVKGAKAPQGPNPNKSTKPTPNK